MPKLAAPPTPTTPPIERRRFQLTNLGGNNNKFYLIELWAAPGGQLHFRASFGRVGGSAQTDERLVSRAWVEAKIAEKQAKGYREVTLDQGAAVSPTALATVARGPVEQLVARIYQEAGEQIKSYLSVAVDALSAAQVATGRTLLQQAQTAYVAWWGKPLRAA